MQNYFMNFIKKLALPIIIITILTLPPFPASAVSIPDPLNAADIFEVAARFIQAVLGLVGAFALFNFIIAGFGVILSKGNPESLKKHKDTLLWTTMGIFILFAAYAWISYILEKLSGG